MNGILRKQLHSPLLPAIFFALIGLADIAADLYRGQLKYANLIFNMVLILPLLVRHRHVYLLFGIIGIAGSSYILLALLVWLGQYLSGRSFGNPVETFVAGPAFALLCLGMSLRMLLSRRDPVPGR